MSVRWISRVWEDSPYEGRALLLHLALADFANDDGICYPSQKTLALKARTTEGWTATTIKQMVKDGFVEILERGGGRGNRTVYQLKKHPTQLGETQKPETESQETLQNDGRVSSNMNRQEPSIELREAFDRFWSAYPRKVAKQAARNVFLTVMKRDTAPDLETLLKAVSAYAKAQSDPKYVAHPTTWLRQGRWEDELPEPATSAPVQRDEDLQRALDRVVPMALLGKSWEEALEQIAECEPHVVSRCREVFDEVRRH